MRLASCQFLCSVRAQLSLHIEAHVQSSISAASPGVRRAPRTAQNSLSRGDREITSGVVVLLRVQGHLARIAESDDLGRLGLSRVPPPPRSCEVPGKLSQCVHVANCTSCRSNAMNKFLTRLGQVAGRLVGAGCLPRIRACPKALSSPALLVLQAMVTQQEVHVSWAPLVCDHISTSSFW